MARPPTNAEIAEMLAREAEAGRRKKDEARRSRALRRAANAAIGIWPEEAAEIHASGRSLKEELWGVGPGIEKRLLAWIDDPPPEFPEPPATRRAFMTRAEARRI